MSQLTITPESKEQNIVTDDKIQQDLLCKGNPELWDSPYLSSFDRFAYLESNPELNDLEEEVREDRLEEASKIHASKRMLLEAQAIAICNQCPLVKKACLDMSLDFERRGAKIHGVTAGMGEVERRKIVKRLNREERKAKEAEELANK